MWVFVWTCIFISLGKYPGEDGRSHGDSVAPFGEPPGCSPGLQRFSAPPAAPPTRPFLTPAVQFVSQ